LAAYIGLLKLFIFHFEVLNFTYPNFLLGYAVLQILSNWPIMFLLRNTVSRRTTN